MCLVKVMKHLFFMNVNHSKSLQATYATSLPSGTACQTPALQDKRSTLCVCVHYRIHSLTVSEMKHLFWCQMAIWGFVYKDQEI